MTSLPERVFSWLFAYPLLLLPIVLFWMISWLGFGEGLGLPDLVWEDRWWPRFFAGLSVSMLFGNALLVRAMLDRRPGSIPPNFGMNWSLFWFVRDLEVKRVGAFLLWTWLPALAIFYLPKMFAWTEWKTMGAPGSMLCGLLTSVLLTCLTVGVMWWKEMSIAPPKPWHGGWLTAWLPAFHGNNARPATEKPLHAMVTLATYIPLFGIAVFLLEHLLFNAVWSPVWLLCITLALLNSIYGFVTFQLAGLQYTSVFLVVLIMLVSNIQFPDKMTFPGLEDTPKPVNLNDDPPAQAKELDLFDTREMLATFHNKWGQEKRDDPKGSKPKLVIIATTGGGIQAAVWTATVLEGLEQQLPGDTKTAAFRNHIRLITGASGGMQAAGLYAADFVERNSNMPLSTQLARDSLWPTVQTMIAHDFPGLVIPKRFKSDRGRTLEEAWEWNCRPWRDEAGNPCDPPDVFNRVSGRYASDPSPLTKTFWEMRGAERECLRPSLIFSPMLVEDCRRLLISNMSMEWFTHTRANNLNPPVSFVPADNPDLVSVPAIELWRYFPEARNKFKVSTAARMSATFPFVGPAVNLPTNPPRRVVDAGYFDNFGINLAAMWLYHHREEIKAHTSGVVIVEIRAYKRREEKLRFELGANEQQGEETKAELFTWAMSEVSSPLEAIINLYSRGAYFRNDQLLHILDREFNVPPCTPADAPREKKFLATVVFECGQPAALSWTLPKRDATKIREQFVMPSGELHKDVKSQVEELKKWFGSGGGP